MTATLILTVTACVKSSDHTTKVPLAEATGKGNGGNNIKLSDADIKSIFASLKPRLHIVFESLSYITEAESISPGNTGLEISNEMLAHLKTMFGGDTPALEDLATSNNLQLQEAPCKDFRGVDNFAAAVIKDVGGPICFSTRQIKRASIKNFDKSAEIFILALATHEFVHHFVSTGTSEKDEQAAQEIQSFVEEQLVRQVEVGNDSIISTEESAYLERFRDYAKDLSESVLPDPSENSP
jgi:hypothetical protein